MPRQHALEEKIRQVLSKAIHFELNDPGLMNVTITRIKLSPDLQFADIRFATYDTDDHDFGALDTLNRAKGALKHLLAKKIKVRKVPELRFHFDEDIFAERRVEEILNNLTIPAELEQRDGAAP